MPSSINQCLAIDGGNEDNAEPVRVSGVCGSVALSRDYLPRITVHRDTTGP